MANKFSRQSTLLNSPGRNAYDVVPNDSEDLAFVTRKIYVGQGGHLKVLLENDTVPVILKNVPTGACLELCVKRIYIADTSALYIVAIY